MILDDISGKEREVLTWSCSAVIISRSQIKMSYAQSTQKSTGCQKGLKECSNVVNQTSETLVSSSQENITVEKTCISRGQKKCLAKDIFGVGRANTSNFRGHKRSKYLGMGRIVTRE